MRAWWLLAVLAERLEHWKRVYRPRGRMADVTAP
jgi:hypothetical protein